MESGKVSQSPVTDESCWQEIIVSAIVTFPQVYSCCSLISFNMFGRSPIPVARHTHDGKHRFELIDATVVI